MKQIQPNQQALAQLLPDSAKKYRRQGADQFYDSESLYTLIDGGAEVYRSLNVRAVLDRKYVHPNAADIIVDLFDMGSATDAYGAYHHDIRENEDVGIGQESEYQGGSLFFWKDRYFVSIVALEQNRTTKSAAIEIGRRIAQAIPKPGSPPEIARRLPKQGLQKADIYFFHDKTSFERRYSIGPGNPLNLGPSTDGILARYRFAGEAKSPAVLLVLVYPTASLANRAAVSLGRTYVKTASMGTAQKVADGHWAAVQKHHRYLYAVLKAPDKQTTVKLLNRALSRSEDK